MRDKRTGHGGASLLRAPAYAGRLKKATTIGRKYLLRAHRDEAELAMGVGRSILSQTAAFEQNKR